MLDKKMVPEIRFKGFKEEWNNLYLFQLIKYAKSGGTPNTANRDFWNGNIPFLTIADLKNKTYIIQTAKSITELGLYNSSAWLVPSGALVLSIYATIGKSAILSCDMATSQAFLSILTNNNSARFLHRIFQRMELNNSWSSLQSTGTQSNLNAHIIKNIDVRYPKSKSETDKISDLFENIDDFISFQEQKLEKLQSIKQSLLDKMFASYDNKVPEIRFKGFEENFEVIRLNEIAEYKNGKGHEKFVLEKGKYILVNSKFISSNASQCKYTNINISPLFKNDIVMVLSDVPGGKALAKTFLIDDDDKYALNQRICALTSKSTSPIYLNIILNRNCQLLVLDDRVNQTNINRQQVMDLLLLIPSYAEQRKIGQFFSNLDSLIRSQEQKLEKLNNIKQALLEKMFC
ncbi:restriction endonuclease subunit S [Mycoplasma sp. MV126]|uniref:restriction endonuclease subunit S n=1 Tax=Mycoplasma sp. MV126 TaxID=3401676 RepID=UPI003AAB105F